MKRIRILIGMLFLAAMFTYTKELPLSAAETEVGVECVVVQKDRSIIDWSKNYIETTGMAVAPENMKGAQAKAMARRGAVVDLQRNMLEFLAGVQVDARTTMNDFMAEDRVRTEVHGMIQNIELLDGQWDGESYTITGRIRLPQLLICVTPSLPRQPAPKPSGETKTAGKFTGLVIDARHLSIIPSLSFKVLDEKGNAVYGVRFADQKFLAQSGLATYYNNLNYAKGELRVAANPIVTKAVKVAAGNGDIVIPNSAASKVRGSSYDFRKECKVIIVCK